MTRGRSAGGGVIGEPFDFAELAAGLAFLRLPGAAGLVVGEQDDVLLAVFLAGGAAGDDPFAERAPVARPWGHEASPSEPVRRVTSDGQPADSGQENSGGVPATGT
jgi:hypothetical protein